MRAIHPVLIFCNITLLSTRTFQADVVAIGKDFFMAASNLSRQPTARRLTTWTVLRHHLLETAHGVRTPVLASSGRFLSDPRFFQNCRFILSLDLLLPSVLVLSFRSLLSSLVESPLLNTVVLISFLLPSRLVLSALLRLYESPSGGIGVLIARSLFVA